MSAGARRGKAGTDTHTSTVLSTFANERSVVLREQTASMYSIPAYFGSKMLVEFPLRLVIPFVSASCTYWIVGLQRTAAKWFICEYMRPPRREGRRTD